MSSPAHKYNHFKNKYLIIISNLNWRSHLVIQFSPKNISYHYMKNPNIINRSIQLNNISLNIKTYHTYPDNKDCHLKGYWKWYDFVMFKSGYHSYLSKAFWIVSKDIFILFLKLGIFISERFISLIIILTQLFHVDSLVSSVS